MSDTDAAEKLRGRVALVTGASRGIGRGIARRLARAGAKVVVSARSLEKPVELEGTLAETIALIEADGGEATAIAADIEVPEQRDRLVEETVEMTGRLDILVNNAGRSRYASVETMSGAIFDGTVDHYFGVPFKLCQAAIPVMRSQGQGWIVNVGSVTSQRPLKPYDEFTRSGGATVYAAIKAALSRFTQGLAAELQADGIAVNLVAPSSAISTPGADEYIPEGYPTEPVEYLAEVAYELCHLPASERTGLLAHSLHFVRALGLTAHGLDDGQPLGVPEIPLYAHPEVYERGE